MKIAYFLICLYFGILHLWGQKEYHFYSDQVAVVKSNQIKNSYNYHTLTSSGKLFVSLNVVLEKKKLNPKAPVNFNIKEFKNNILVNETQISKTYSEIKDASYVFNLEYKINAKDSSNIEIKTATNSPIGNIELKIKAFNNEQNIQSFTLLNKDLITITDNFYIVDQPLTTNSSKEKVFVKWIEFSDHIPQPMIGLKTKKQFNLKPFVTKELNSHQVFIPSQKGTYVFSDDSSFKTKQVVHVIDENFPQIKNAQGLIEPLTYLCDSTEFAQLTSKAEENSKIALDNFWLNKISNKQVAKQTIKWYYNRVFQANNMYTFGIQGWKTDLGMLYILFGPPKSIENNGKNTLLTYENGVKVLADTNTPQNILNYNEIAPKIEEAISFILKGKKN